MKDYSNLIPTAYGYVTKYEIVGDEIHIYTPESKKGEPHKYPLNEEWLSKIEKRLENQYQLIVENRAVLKKFKIKEFVSKMSPAMNISAGVLGVTTIILTISGTLLCIPTCAAALFLFFSKRKLISKYAKQIDNEMDIIESYLQNKQEIEDLSQTDKNITEYLGHSAAKRLSVNKELKENGTITSAFNADFMDKTNNKELRKMLDRYMISKGLLEEQAFVNPFESSVQESKKERIKKR